MYTPTASVPEPATSSAVLLGLGLLGAARRRTGHALRPR
ncbi:PEP-CTERM sorting domain-containing protein [Methylomagnum ishizawai]|nr:PEP-CTERM sorting domain-containing protein [Methylomagnum ishizawai]